MTAIEYFEARCAAALPDFAVVHGNGMTIEQFNSAVVTDEAQAVFISWGGFSSGGTALNYAGANEGFTIVIRTTLDDDIRERTKAFFNEVYNRVQRMFTNEDGERKVVSLLAGIVERTDFQTIEISAEVA